MTKRLYYTDSYQTEFDATVIDLAVHSERPAIVLDQTCFYPTSGGQAYDVGQLGNQRVIDVIAEGQDRVVHVLAGPLAGVGVGATVHGVIDWPRRYDHMQQHSGQHLLSQVFHERFGYETLSVHFGTESSTLDLDAESLVQEQLDEAESYVNELVYKALPITAYFVDEAEIGRLPLRRPPKVSGLIRIVEIEKFDYSACGGTHCHTTAEIAPVKLLRQERRRGQTRVTFLCGRRSLADYGIKHRLLMEAANLFSNEPAQVPELIARNLEQVKELRRQLDIVTERQLGYEAVAIGQTAQPLGEYRVIAHVFTDKDVNALKSLASLLQESKQTIILLVTTADAKLTTVFARAADVDLHMGNLLRDSLRAFGGGGGGRADFAQGGGVDPGVATELIEFAIHKLKTDLLDL